MKHIFAFLIASIITATVFAQSPQAISYQAVIRDATNNLVPNQSVGMQISILQGTADGTEVYIETQTPETNTNGLISIEIGTGTIVSGDFAAIDWATGPYFIKTDVDPEGGEAYTITGISQLLSVPYAMYANKAGNTFSGDYNDLTNQPGFTGWDTNVTDDFDGDYNNLTNTPDFTDWDTNVTDDFSGNFNDLTDVPTNLDVDVTDDFSGDYNDLTNKPDFANWDTDPTDDFEGNYNSLTNTPDFTGWDTNAADDFSGSYNDVVDLPEFLDIDSTDDFSGNYNDLTNKPDFTGWDTDTTDDFNGQYNNLIGIPTNISHFLNDVAYLTYYSENDPIYSASPASTITESNIINWNTDISETNEIQIISISNDTLYLTNGNFAVLPKGASSLDDAYHIGQTITADNDAFEVAGTDGVLFSGTLGEGTIPASGSGTRMMWYPRKAAFRTGTVSNNEWDDENIGNYSFAAGDRTTASGDYSTAIGRAATATGEASTALGYRANASGVNSVALSHYANASGDNSIAIGNESIADGEYGIAMGKDAHASGNNAIAMGEFTNATGDFSTAMGFRTNAESYNSVTIGRYNVGGGDANNWVETDPLFEIGNGSSDTDKSNALTVYKNGNIEISGDITGVTDPTDPQHIVTKAYVDNGYQVGDIMFGGIIFWVDETHKHGLVASLEDQASEVPWDQGYALTRATGTSVFSGKRNTNLIIITNFQNGEPEVDYAAGVCVNYNSPDSLGNYGDWFLPSIDELELMYQNRDIINSVAASNGGQQLSSSSYWSSSEVTNLPGMAKIFSFTNGNSSTIFKTSTYGVRAIRQF